MVKSIAIIYLFSVPVCVTNKNCDVKYWQDGYRIGMMQLQKKKYKYKLGFAVQIK